MGCVLSSIDEDENVRKCKERKRAIKQLVKIRGAWWELREKGYCFWRRRGKGGIEGTIPPL